MKRGKRQWTPTEAKTYECVQEKLTLNIPLCLGVHDWSSIQQDKTRVLGNQVQGIAHSKAYSAHDQMNQSALNLLAITQAQCRPIKSQNLEKKQL